MDKVGKVVDLPENIARGGIERGLCEDPDDPAGMTKKQLLAEIQKLPGGTEKLEALGVRLKVKNPGKIKNADLVALIRENQE